jgi:hypothetical protein
MDRRVRVIPADQTRRSSANLRQRMRVQREDAKVHQQDRLLVLLRSRRSRRWPRGAADAVRLGELAVPIRRQYVSDVTLHTALRNAADHNLAVFDTGSLSNEHDRAAQVMRELQAIMQPEIKPQGQKSALIEVHDSVWQRIVRKSSAGTHKRYAQGLELYCNGAVQQVVDSSDNRLPTVQEMMDTRRDSIASLPFFALMEYAEGINLPEEVFEHPAMKQLHRVATDFALLYVSNSANE